MDSDRSRWNRKYRDRTYSDTPAEIVTRYYSMAAVGRALDIGAGTGKNALFLAEHDFEVDAVDISDVAMESLSGRHPGVRAICDDLDRYNIARSLYTLILNIRYLNRRLYPQIVQGLCPGGLLIFETYIESPEEGDGPACRDYLLRENELLHAFLSMKIVYYEEKKETGPKGSYLTASLVARKTFTDMPKCIV